MWVSGVEYEGLYLQYHDNGQLSEKSYWKDGERHGLYLVWFKNGDLYERCHYDDGERITEYSEYYDNGQPSLICTYDNESLKDYIQYDIDGNRVE